MNKLSKIIAFIKTSNIVLNVPKKSSYLIYDFHERFDLKPLNIYNFTKLNLKTEINLWVLLNCFFNLNLWKIQLRKSYCISYIKLTDPKVIITFTDNDILFYKLKTMFPKKKFISIQNGTRSRSQDIFGYEINEKLSCDFIYTHNDFIAKKYRDIIKTKTITFGSYLSNITPKEKSKHMDILFISQYEEKKVFAFKNYKNQQVSWEQYYFSESKILPMLDNFCYQNNLNLNICSRFDSNIEEKNFFTDNIKKIKFNFIDKYKKLNSYNLVDNSKLVIFVDSTLGYESIARKNKTIALSTRGKFVADSSFNFAWPINLEKNGSFWTDDLKEKNIMDLLKYNFFIEDKAWIKNNLHIINQIMPFESSLKKLSFIHNS